MIYHLDTDTFTLASYRRADVVEEIAKHRVSDTVEIPIVTRLQVLNGRIASALKAADATQLNRAFDLLTLSEELLATFPIALYSDHAGLLFDTVLAERKYKKIGIADRLIACIALAHDAILVTRNTKDFSVIPGLKLENWAD